MHRSTYKTHIVKLLRSITLRRSLKSKINEVSACWSACQSQLEGDTQADRVRNWHNHFEGHLGSSSSFNNETEDIDPVFTDLNIKTEPSTSEEYTKAKKSIWERKGCGEDKIRPEILKQYKSDLILDFCNTAFIKRVSLEQWSISTLVPIAKAGKLSKGVNYHRIALGSIVLKTYNRIILYRLRPEINCKLRMNQNRFRKGRTTISQMLTLRKNNGRCYRIQP